MKLNRFGSLFVACALIASIVAPQAAFATTIKLDGSTTLQPLAQSWASKYHSLHPSVSIIVAGGGSGVGFSDVNNGNVDIGMSSREPKSGTFETGLTKYRVAKDAVCVAVNPNNTVRNLTPLQIKKIFTGVYTNWKQVGGPNATIIRCGRTGASGTYAYFKEQFLGGTRQASSTKQYASNGMVRSAVGRMRYAIGYMSIAYLNSSVVGVKVSGVSPTKSNAASGKYPYVRPLYFLTKGSVPSAVRSFISWCEGTAGQVIAMKEYLHR